jgi:hypothetical protein
MAKAKLHHKKVLSYLSLARVILEDQRSVAESQVRKLFFHPRRNKLECFDTGMFFQTFL